MLVHFKSKAAAEVVMYEEHAKRILDLLHKDVSQGIITVAELPQAIATLEEEIAFIRRNPSTDVIHHESLAHEGDHEEEEHDAATTVSFATRTYPLLEMLRAAQTQGCNVMWGV